MTFGFVVAQGLSQQAMVARSCWRGGSTARALIWL